MGWRDFKNSLPVDYVDKEDYVTPESVLNPHNPLNPPRVCRKLIDENEVEAIASWLDRVIRADTTDDVLSIVDSCRPLDWTDEERSRMSRTYNARINGLTASEKEQPSEAPQPSEPTRIALRISKWEMYRRAKQEAKAKRLRNASGAWWGND